MLSLSPSKPKSKRKCVICKAQFAPYSSMERWCSPAHGFEWAQIVLARKARSAAKVERAEDAKRREAMKRRSDHIKEAQVAFNSYIRARDAGKPCICCGLPLADSAVGGGFDCGHYRSVGSAPHLRYDERNAHGQRKQCNRYGSGRAVDYRIGLIARIGREAVEAVEASNAPRKWTIEELKAIRAEYKAKLKELQKQGHAMPQPEVRIEEVQVSDLDDWPEDEMSLY